MLALAGRVGRCGVGVLANLRMELPKVEEYRGRREGLGGGLHGQGSDRGGWLGGSGGSWDGDLRGSLATNEWWMRRNSRAALVGCVSAWASPPRCLAPMYVCTSTASACVLRAHTDQRVIIVEVCAPKTKRQKFFLRKCVRVRA